MLKTTFTEIFIFILSFAFSQDTSKLKQIDSLVNIINTSSLPVQRDSLVQDHPEWGLKMTTHLSMVVHGGELIKYVNLVNTSRIENEVARQMVSSNTFYFEHNKLIKVEEFLIEGEKKKTVDWYYSEDKPLCNTAKSDQSEDRATMLLSLSATMLKKIIK